MSLRDHEISQLLKYVGAYRQYLSKNWDDTITLTKREMFDLLHYTYNYGFTDAGGDASDDEA